MKNENHLQKSRSFWFSKQVYGGKTSTPPPGFLVLQDEQQNVKAKKQNVSFRSGLISN